MLPASPRRPGVSSVHPQRHQGFDPTFAQSIILFCCTPEEICKKYIVRTQRFLADNDPGTPKKVAVVAVVHHISWATTRASPSKHVGGLMGKVDVVVVVAVVHHISWAAVRAGPLKHMDRLMGRVERPMLSEPTSHGPRPGPAHQISRGWAAARPGPSKFQRMGHGPARPITFSIFHGPARPGPSIFPKSRPGPARAITFSKVSTRSGPAQTTGP